MTQPGHADDPSEPDAQAPAVPPLDSTQEETYLDEETLLQGLVENADDDEVVGLDDTAAALDDPAALLPDMDDGGGDSLQRWHDVGPAEDAVDPGAGLFPDADESGYTREGDAVGIEGDLGVEALFADLGPRVAPADHDAPMGMDVLGGLELPALPALVDAAEGGELGPDEDTDLLAEELLRRSARDKSASPDTNTDTDMGPEPEPNAGRDDGSEG